jgi:phosphatidylinositol glycan class W
MMMSPLDYRRLQVESVSGLTGSSPWYVACTLYAIQLAIIFGLFVGRNIFLEAGVFVGVPMAIVFGRPEVTYMTSAIFAACFVCISRRLSSMRERLFAAKPQKAFIGAFKAQTALLTTLCILGVDFSSFPRCHAKTEDHGLSLMDLGVGGTVFSMGLTGSRLKTWRQCLQSAAFVALLGFVRLLAVKAVGYQEHVTEYGRHWNFFFTLALLPVCHHALKAMVGTVKFPLLVGILLLARELFFRYMPSVPWPSLIWDNRAGLWSFWGFLCVYLLTSWLHVDLSLMRVPAQWRRYRFKLLSSSVVSLIMGHFCGLASRRWANMAYVLWTMAICGLQLWTLFELELCGFLASRLLAFVSQHQLLLFLVSNVLTGLVNLSMQTLMVPYRLALMIMLVYSCLSLALTFLLSSVFQ